MNIHRTLTLLDAVANNVTGPSVTIDIGGTYNLAVNGTFSGATVSLEVLGPDGTNYTVVPGAEFTSASIVSVDLAAGSVVRGVTTDVGTPELYAELKFVG